MTADEYLDALLSLPAMTQATLPNVGRTTVSRDGRWAAWTWFRAGPAADVYAAPTDGSSAPIRLTDTAHTTSLVSWTPDSRAVLVAQDQNGNERSQLFRVDLEQPLVMVPLTEPNPNYYIRGGELHPNGRWLVYGANFDAATGQEIEPTWIYRHDLETGERWPLARLKKRGFIWPELSPTGSHVLYTRMDLHPAGRQIWLVDIEGRQDREILNFGPDTKTFASWFPDGRRVLVLANTPIHRRLGVWEIGQDAGPSPQARWLLDDPLRNIETAFVPHRSEQIVVVDIHQARPCVSLLDATTGEETRLTSAPGTARAERNTPPLYPLPQGERRPPLPPRRGKLGPVLSEVEGMRVSLSALPGTLIPLAPLKDGVWVGQHYSSHQPTDLVRFSLADLAAAPSPIISGFSPHGSGYEPKPAARSRGPEAHAEGGVRLDSLLRVWDRTLLTPEDLTAAEEFHWMSVDGLEIQGWLYRPRFFSGRTKGTIVYVHGGPAYHSEDLINNQIQFFAHQGFNVLDPNYRGSTGFSLSFRDSIKVDGWGGLEQDDIRSGIEALLAAGIAEPGKVGITGTSYGGYSAWCSITRFPREIVAAAASICGMTDLVVDYQTTRPDLRPYCEEMMGGSPDQIPDRYRERSPVHFIGNIQGQLLIIQGLRDPNVTPENLRVVISALEQAGVPYQVLTFEDEGHGISKPKNQRTLYLSLVKFFENAFAR